MINVKVNAKAERQNDFPKLMKSDNGLIVLFSNHGVGMVVSPNEVHGCGKWTDDWCMGVFAEFEGSITLCYGE